MLADRWGWRWLAGYLLVSYIAIQRTRIRGFKPLQLTAPLPHDRGLDNHEFHKDGGVAWSSQGQTSRGQADIVGTMVCTA
jgi:hypothetical protein